MPPQSSWWGIKLGIPKPRVVTTPHAMMTSSNGNIFRITGLCAGNSPVTGEFPSQRPVARSFDVFFDLRLNKQLRKQSRHRLFDTPSRSLWRRCNASHCDVTVMVVMMCYGHPIQGPVSLRIMTSQFKDIVSHAHKSKPVKCIFCDVWVQNFVWNFKGALWNFTQNFESIHRKICISQGVKNFDSLRYLRVMTS